MLCIVRPHTHSTPVPLKEPENDRDAQRVRMFLECARRSKGARGAGSDDLERIFKGDTQGIGVDTDSVITGTVIGKHATEGILGEGSSQCSCFLVEDATATALFTENVGNASVAGADCGSPRVLGGVGSSKASLMQFDISSLNLTVSRLC